MALIIDDGVRGRGHRRNIFNPSYNAVGAAYGPDARYGSVCSIDFANSYAEATLVRAGTDAVIRLNEAAPTIGRGAAGAALFRESVERTDRP
jgi:hypothetical protein